MISKREMDKRVTVFFNCRVLRGYDIVRDEVWVSEGKIIDPEVVQRQATDRVNCRNAIVAPGFIDLQVNGAFGVDFLSHNNLEEGLKHVSRRLPETGVTSYVPTLITSPADCLRRVIVGIKSYADRAKSDASGAEVLGIYCEGPFINFEKKGAHPKEYIRSFCSSQPGDLMSSPMTNAAEAQRAALRKIEEVYGEDLSFILMITLAPELAYAEDVIRDLTARNIVVSLGHSTASLDCAERAFRAGARMITHLFNAMPAFHPQDPALPGLLCSKLVSDDTPVYFGLIADGVHTHEAALRIAYRLAPRGLVLVTDALCPMGLPDGHYKLGKINVTVSGTPKSARVTDTNTLSGCVATLDACIRHFRNATRCSVGYALAAATLHPAFCLKVSSRKGTLDFGTDADLVLLNDDLFVLCTYIRGVLVFDREASKQNLIVVASDS